MHCIYFHPNNARPTTWPSPFLPPRLPYNRYDRRPAWNSFFHWTVWRVIKLSAIISQLYRVLPLALSPPRSIPYLLFQFQKLRASIPSPSPLVPPLLVHSSNKTIRGLSRGFSETRDTIAKFPLVSPLERNCTSERGWGKG